MNWSELAFLFLVWIYIWHLIRSISRIKTILVGERRYAKWPWLPLVFYKYFHRMPLLSKPDIETGRILPFVFLKIAYSRKKQFPLRIIYHTVLIFFLFLTFISVLLEHCFPEVFQIIISNNYACRVVHNDNCCHVYLEHLLILNAN